MNTGIGGPFTDQELKRGYWIATHRTTFSRTAMGIAIGFVALLVAIAVGMFVWFLAHIPETRAIDQELATRQVRFENALRPQPLQVIQATAVRSEPGKVDVVIRMKNPNTRWITRHVEYELLVGSSTVPTRIESFAPEQEKMLVTLDQIATQETLPTVRVTIQEVQWEKMRSIELPQTQWQFVNPQLRAMNLSQTAPSTVNNREESGMVNASQTVHSELTLNLRNGSVYGFREPDVIALLSDSSGAIVAVDKITLDAIRSLESRPLIFRFPVRATANLQPVLYVNADIIDDRKVIRNISE